MMAPPLRRRFSMGPLLDEREPELRVSTEDARAGKTGVGVRYVLIASLILAIGGMLAALFLYGNNGPTL